MLRNLTSIIICTAAVAFQRVHTEYFGNNFLPSCPEEAVCDGLVLLTVACGLMIGFGGKKKLTHAESILSLLNELREGEGDTVTLMCDNPDFNGLPDRAVECCGHWTDWHTERFQADTLHECLWLAVKAKRASCRLRQVPA